MKTLWLDYESFYVEGSYTLKKMTPAEYILDPRWETIGLAAAEGDGEVEWIEGPDVEGYFGSKNPEDYRVVHHNALFDACISSYRYGWVPRQTFCTMAMARAMLYGRTGSVSLASVAEDLGVGVKGDEIVRANAMTLAALKSYPDQYRAYIEYAKTDVRLCRAAFMRMIDMGFPPMELSVIDMVTRCAIQPQFEVDVDLVAQHLHEVVTNKQLLLTKAMLAGLDGKDELTSRDKFAALLSSLGVDPPRKISPATGKLTWALAKTDREFKALEEHWNPAVQAVVAARLGHQTTLEESRSQRFINIGQLDWPSGAKHAMPMPMRYSGAHTHRLSGEWKINVQNLRKGGKLRQALRAPAGSIVVAADASQIEARIVAWIARSKRLLGWFAEGADVYCNFASRVYGRPITKADKAERFLGKTAVLGLGYGMGAERFENTVRIQSGGEVVVTRKEAERVVEVYREAFWEIPDMWKTLDRMLWKMNDKDWGGEPLGPVRCEYRRIVLPSGMAIQYNKLHRTGEGDWSYFFGKEQRWLFGGKVLENIVQALARVVVMDAAVGLKGALARLGVQLALQVHDELVYVVPDGMETVVRKMLLDALRRRPSWAADLPLDAEAGSGPNYGSLK